MKVVAIANDDDVREIYWGPLSISQSISFCLYFDDTFFGSVVIIDDFDTSGYMYTICIVNIFLL